MVGTLGAGGKGYFVLDVTNPGAKPSTSITTSRPEFTNIPFAPDFMARKMDYFIALRKLILRIALMPTEFSILHILLENLGTVVSVEDLFKSIWQDEYYRVADRKSVV